ncbi:Lrp/AsnC family transcriptional regulator [Gordonia sp. (in: high G+C Gram-positive bacteria)]|uniref:Lrp/AsnC family transcriptional regulator n=1 Tax=Gordonia sp. (in: high G+C Gram-positive bacteria) TaxID=84139 RepID=UPI0035294AB7
MPNPDRIDRSDALILRALNDDPRATVIALATTTGLSRNTVQARLARLQSRGALRSFERCVDPAALGYPLTAFVFTVVTQRKLAGVAEALAAIPEVIEVQGLSGVADLLIHVVARDADDLYRVAGQILDVDGVKKTTTGLVMRRLIDYRTQQLLDPAD